MDRLQRYRNDIPPSDSHGPPPSATVHVARPPRSVSSLTHQRPSLVLQTPSPTRIHSSYRFPPSPAQASPSSPRISRTAVRPNFPQHRNSNHSLLAQLDSPNMPSARGMGIPTLPADYTRGRSSVANGNDRLSAAGRSRSHGRPSVSHTRSNSSISSGISSTSSGSLFERGRAGSIAGSETSDDSRSIASVRTNKTGKEVKNRPSKLSLKSRTRSQARTAVPEEDEDEIIPPVPPVPATAGVTRQVSYGPTLWERLVATATVAAKEWSFYGEGEDEDEPNTAGGETHLTAVLKTYYIDRARSKTDLPQWLFEGRELNVATPLYSASTQYASPAATPRTGATPRTAVPASAASAASNQSLSHIYESYARSPSANALRSPPPATRTQNRLRELRDAKRMANLAVVDPSNGAAMRPLLSAGLASRPKSRRLPAGPKTGRI